MTGYRQNLSFAPGVVRELLAHTDAYTVTRLSIEKGAKSPPHSHPHEQVVYILEGGGLFQNGAELITVGQGDCVRIASEVPHGFSEVSQATRMLEFFVPGRTDIAEYHSRQE